MTVLVAEDAPHSASHIPDKTFPSIAVLDVETTGLNKYKNDRIVEIAVVLITPGKGIIAEISTLLNPERDIGPTSIHGLTSTDILHAPRFEQVAAELVNTLQKAATIAGHNVRFDVGFLRSEYERMGVMIPEFTPIDTMLLTGGGSLSTCCAEHGIKYEGRAHAALNDARATAQLLDRILCLHPALWDSCIPLHAIKWPCLLGECPPLFPREKLRDLHAQAPGYIERLAARLLPVSTQAPRTDAEREYRSLLYRVLEDGRVDESEGDSLIEVAANSGLSFAQVEAIHREYLTQLGRAALADGRITDAERRELQAVARLLGPSHPPECQIDDLLQTCSRRSAVGNASPTATNWAGKTICFTGECQCSIAGTPITRSKAEQLAIENGMKVLPSVTKKLNLLVVADPDSQSGKSKRARQYGIRIIHEPVFWRGLGIPID